MFSYKFNIDFYNYYFRPGKVKGYATKYSEIPKTVNYNFN